MKAPFRIAAIMLWFGPAAVCLMRALAQGFTYESFHFTLFLHNGLNPYYYHFPGDPRKSSLVGFSVVMSVLLLTSCILVKPSKKADLILFGLALLSYVAAFVGLCCNFTPA